MIQRVTVLAATMRVLCVLCASAAARPAAAHDLWIEPSAFHPAPGATIDIRLRVGMNFIGDPLPRYGSLVQRFDLSSRDGERSIEGNEGDEPAGRIAIPSAGAHLVGYRSNNSYVSQEPQKFEEYLKEEGLEQIIRIRAGRGESQKPSREFFARCAKALVVSGSGPRTGFDRVLGFTLEIVPEKDPEAWQAGGDLVFRILYEGKPLSGALLVALPQREPSRKLSARSDAGGRATLRLPHAGVWLVKAVHMIPFDGGKADWQSFWASLTLEIPDRRVVRSAQ
jgi:uncharacterized GH25 family protein